MTLSVIIITKNEEQNMRGCLESVSWADEIIVVDSGSTDGTVGICKDFGTKVFVTDWPGFGPQKNRALDLATGDWVLSLDADERVPAELRSEIQSIIANPGVHVAFRIPRSSSYCGRVMRHSGWWPDYVTRLFLRGRARFSNDLVHEQLRVEGSVGKLKQFLMHEAVRDLEQALNKINAYTSAGAENLFRSGRRASIATAMFRASWAFLRTYVLRAGFLDGREGFMLALNAAMYTFYRYVKLRYLWESHDRLRRKTGRSAISKNDQQADSTLIHVVEPTLMSESGHCYGLVLSLCEAAPQYPLCLWVARGARLTLPQRPNLDVRLHFWRRIRKLQLLPLYWRLLRRPGVILITTAQRLDLLALTRAARGPVPMGKVFAYFHRIRMNRSKEALFRRIAAKHPNITILCTTLSVMQVFQKCGFQRTVHLPLPLAATHSEGGNDRHSFRRLLFAGAARGDKGFDKIVGLVSLLAENSMTIPITVQTSADHYNKYSPDVRLELERLQRIRYPHLTVLPETLERSDYLRMFAGAICLQPYDPGEFQDRASGVTLDALTAGAPVIAPAGTWMARIVDRFGAGIVVSEMTCESLYEAACLVIEQYERFSENARVASIKLRNEHNWDPFLRLVANPASCLQDPQ